MLSPNPVESFSKPDKPPRFLRTAEVIARFGIHPSTFWRLRQRDSTFPRPYRIGLRAIGWSESEVQQWLDSQHNANG